MHIMGKEKKNKPDVYRWALEMKQEEQNKRKVFLYWTAFLILNLK